MDAFIQLALIEKAKRVFSSDPNVMLSFPILAPLELSESAVAALASPQSVADYLIAGDFARAVNFLPRDVVASASEQNLWEVFANVLARADVASDAIDHLDGSRAASILYDVAPDGTRTESEQFKRYRQYRDAWIVARENYASHKLTGELSEDSAVRRQWKEVEEPELRTILEATLTDWEILGNRSGIESAIQKDREAALQNPSLRWSEWSRSFSPDIDLLTEVSGSQFAPTGLSPSDFVSAGNWLQFELTTGEIDTLVAEAPDRFRDILGDSSNRRYERLTFEYRSVAINRPWFNPEVLTSRIWRTTDANLFLSDGAEPPSGVCPAYATAIVFVRNVRAVEIGGTASQEPQGGFIFDPSLIPPELIAVPLGPLIIEDWDDPVINPFDRLIDTGRVVVEGRATRFPVIIDASVLREPLEVILDEGGGSISEAFQRLDDNSFTVAVPSAETEEAVFASLHLRRRWERDIDGIHIGMAVEGTAVEPPPEPAPSGKLSVLAFICKRLPKAPDPDPSLRWE